MRYESGWRVAIVAALLLGGCGSKEDKLERGVVVDREVASPESKDEMGMTEKQRRAAEVGQEEKQENKLFEESEE